MNIAKRIFAVVLTLSIVGCSGSSDSGTEGVARWAGTYNATSATLLADGTPGAPAAGVMTIRSDGKVNASFPTNIALEGTVDVAGNIRMSGDKKPEGEPAAATLMTGRITGLSAAKQVTDGKVTFTAFPTIPPIDWTAQCVSGCG